MICLNPRINLILLMAIKMVLCGVVAGAGDAAGRVRRAPQQLQHSAHRVTTDEEMDATAAWKRSHWRETQTLLRKKDVAECCPSMWEMVAKKGGRTPTGMYVELYEDGENKQRLYELSCAPNIVNKPCRFVDARLYNQSRCVQKYSFSYALVRYSSASSATEMPERHRPEGHFSLPGSGGWSMDYVEVRAGCECQITPPKRKSQHRKRLERHRQRKKNKRTEEDEDT